MLVSRAAPLVIARRIQQYFVSQRWREGVDPGQRASMIGPVAVGGSHSVRVIAYADRQHDGSAQPVIVGPISEAAEDQVFVGETVVDADRRSVLRRGNQCWSNQVGAE